MPYGVFSDERSLAGTTSRRASSLNTPFRQKGYFFSLPMAFHTNALTAAPTNGATMKSQS